MALKIHPDKNVNVSTANKQLFHIAFLNLKEAYKNLVKLVNKTEKNTHEFQGCDQDDDDTYEEDSEEDDSESDIDNSVNDLDISMEDDFDKFEIRVVITVIGKRKREVVDF